MKRLARLALAIPLLSACAAVSPDSPFFNISDEAVVAQSDIDLCNIYAETSDQRAYEEIQRRGLLTDEERPFVLGRQISSGMTQMAVICSWGRPSDVNRSVGAWGVHEQWVYCGRDA